MQEGSNTVPALHPTRSVLEELSDSSDEEEDRNRKTISVEDEAPPKIEKPPYIPWSDSLPACRSVDCFEKLNYIGDGLDQDGAEL